MMKCKMYKYKPSSYGVAGQWGMAHCKYCWIYDDNDAVYEMSIHAYIYTHTTNRSWVSLRVRHRTFLLAWRLT